jgi:hypothetical protein
MRPEAPSKVHPGILWDAVAIALLALTALVVLSVRVFPTQDGPVHLYYADILRGLLTHSGPYTQHFEIRAFLTPYALEYYSLLALEMMFSPVMSEKLLICCYIFSFGLGFRYLVESVAERRNPWTVVGIPFCMNALVYLGFLNYSMGVALALFLCGSWIRFWSRLTPRRVTGLLAGFALLLFTHPVPTAIFLLFIGLHFLMDLVCTGPAGLRFWLLSLRARWRPLVLIASMGAAAVVWVGMFTDTSQVAPSVPSVAGMYGWIRAALIELQFWPMVPLRSRLYRGCLVVPLAMTLGALLATVWKRRGPASSSAIPLMAISAICFLLYGIVPPVINGSWFFAERFPVFWILFLIAAVAALRPARGLGMAAGALAACVAIGLLLLQWNVVSRIAGDLGPVLDTPVASPGSLGLIIGATTVPGEGLAFDPFMWSGAHYFRRSRAILANTPWMELPLLLIQQKHPDHWSDANPDLAGQLLSDATAAGETLPSLGLVVETGPAGTAAERVMSRMGCSILPGDGRLLRIYRCHP